MIHQRGRLCRAGWRGFAKAQHSVPMLVLANAFEDQDIADFERQIRDFLNSSLRLRISAEPKIDGLSLSLPI